MSKNVHNWKNKNKKLPTASIFFFFFFFFFYKMPETLKFFVFFCCFSAYILIFIVRKIYMSNISPSSFKWILLYLLVSPEFIKWTFPSWGVRKNKEWYMV